MPTRYVIAPRIPLRIASVAVIIAIAVACGKTEHTSSKEPVVELVGGGNEAILGPRSTKVISEPTRVRGYRIISPFDSNFKTAQKTMPLIDEYPILTEAPVARRTSSRIAALLLDRSSYDPSFALTCLFQPRHALRFERGQEFVDVIICFECSDVDIVPAPSLHEQRTTQPFGRVAKPLHDAVSEIFVSEGRVAP